MAGQVIEAAAWMKGGIKCQAVTGLGELGKPDVGSRNQRTKVAKAGSEWRRFWNYVAKT